MIETPHYDIFWVELEKKIKNGGGPVSSARD
jgi:hypothetical protein